MSDNPFAVRESLSKIEALLERLADELRVRRAPLETALANLIFVWDVEPGRHELAARFDAAGGALRADGIADEARRLYAVRAAKSPSLTGTGVDAAFALFDAATEGDAARLHDLLAHLHGAHRDLMPDVRVALVRVAEQLLVAWCTRHAADYPARFQDELQRLELGTHLVVQWHADHKPALSAAAALVLDALLDGTPFAVGWLGAVPDLKDEVYDADEVLHVAAFDPIHDAPKADAFGDLRAAAATLRGNQKVLVLLLCERGGRVPLPDVALACEWETDRTCDTAVYVNSWNSLRYDLNAKLKKHGWRLCRFDSCAVAERLRTSAGK